MNPDHDQDFADGAGDAAHLERQAAYSYVEEAFAEARRDGLDGDCLAHAALFAAFKELVETYGEDAAATFAEGLPDKIRNGAYTAGMRH